MIILKQSYNTFKEIDYKTLSKDTLKQLYKMLCENYLNYDNESNSYFWNSGIKDFDNDLEEFDNYIFDRGLENG